MTTCTRSLALLISLAAIASACGSDGTATSATLPDAEVQTTDIPTTDIPTTDIQTTDVPVTDVPVTDAPVTVPAVDKPADSVQADLDAARQRWADSGITTYTIVTQSICFCIPDEWSDTIVDGVVTEHVSLTVEEAFDPGARSMELLFDQIQQAIDDGYFTMSASFDPDTGAVQQFFVDVDDMMADEEYGVSVLSLDPAA